MHSFLQMARSKLRSDQDFGIHLWIDAICIDQDNFLERGHQVKQMGEIYSAAKTVLVWLGPEVGKSILQAESTMNILENASEQENASSTGYAFENAMEAMKTSRRDVHLIIQEIWDRNYWRRIWTVQEVYCARQARLIIGQRIVTWRLIKRVMHDLQNDWNWPSRKVPRAPPVYILTKRREQKYYHETLCALVEMFHNSECADIRDRVYGILALLPRSQRFPVSYSISREELCCATLMASFITARITTRTHEDSKTVTEFALEGHSGFRRDNIDCRSMKTISIVAKSLIIFFKILEAYLVSEHDLGAYVSMPFRTKRPVSNAPPDEVTRHSYEIGFETHLLEDATLYWRTHITLETSGYPPDNEDAPEDTITIIFEAEKSWLSSYAASSPLQGPWLAQNSFLWLPFKAVVFLIETLQKAVDLQSDKSESQCLAKYHPSRLVCNESGDFIKAIDLNQIPRTESSASA
jgi:hypothetical protein